MSKKFENLEAKEFKELVEQNRLNGWSDLSEAEQAFALSYIDTYTISTTASQLGFSASKCAAMLRNPLVLEFINDLQKHLSGRSVITKDFVNIQWLKLMPKLLGEESVPMVDKDGISYEAKKFHSSEAVSLLKELSKSTNFYTTDDDGNSLDKPKQVVEFVIKTKEQVDNEDG